MIKQYKESMAHRSVFISVMVALSQSISGEQKIRFECEPCMLKLQQLNVYCPPYESCQWYCQEKLANCIPGTKYHCARSFKDNNTFMDACVREIYCPEGEEPWISIDTARSNADQSIAFVFCKPCFKNDRFNSRINTPSATFSICPSLKTNLCTEQEHKIDCGYVTNQERTKTDGYCRCDARKGYAAQSDEMCFYENKHCFKKNCPQGEELLLNYTCAMICPPGFMRTDASDNCQQTVNPSPTVTASVFTTVVEDKENQSSTEKTPLQKSIEGHSTGVFIGVLISIILIIIVVITVYWITREQERSKSLTGISTPDSDSEDSLGQEVRVDDSKRLLDEGLIDESGSEYEYLKDCNIMEPTSWPQLRARIHIPDAPDLEAYTIPGDTTTDLYVVISHLLCGSDELAGILRFAAKIFAQNNFTNYVEKLMEAFNHSKNPLVDSNIFFKMHGVVLKQFEFSFKMEIVSLGLDKLVKGIPVTRETGPFHAAILGRVLNCHIIQHFQNNRFHDRDVGLIAGLKVAFESGSSSDRELHIYWMKTDNYPRSYCIIPLFKDAIPNNVSQTPKPQEKSNVKIEMEKLAEKASVLRRRGFKAFEKSHSGLVFDELKTISFIKPDHVIRTIGFIGFIGYERSDDKISSVFECISYLLCGDQSKTFILRKAAARYARENFETYVEQLLKKFEKYYDAKTFFTAHAITLEKKEWQENKGECMRKAFENLVCDALKTGNAPFHVELLSGVLNRKISQHFEKNTFSYRNINTIPGLDVTLTTESSSGRELHIYWMRSTDNIQQTYSIVPLFKCVPNSPGMELCENVFKLLMDQEHFEAQSCLKMIHDADIYDFENLKVRHIVTCAPSSMQLIDTIKVSGYNAYERPGDETTCLYELISYLLFGNADMQYIIRLVAIRFALQNVTTYVDKLVNAFKNGIHLIPGKQIKNAKVFFGIHGIEFKGSNLSAMGTGVWIGFANLLRETVNTGQGPFYVEFLRGAMNCKIRRFYYQDRYDDQDVRSLPGLKVTLTTISPPERELKIGWKKYTDDQSNVYYKIYPLFKEVKV